MIHGMAWRGILMALMYFSWKRDYAAGVVVEWIGQSPQFRGCSIFRAGVLVNPGTSCGGGGVLAV